MEKTIELTGRQVLKIKTVSTGNKYNVEKDHQFFGKTYNNYSFDGIVFTVNSEDEFVTWKNSGELFAVDLKPGTRTNDKGETVNTLQMVSCVNTAQEIAMAKTEATLQRIFKDSAVETVTDDLINAITA